MEKKDSVKKLVKKLKEMPIAVVSFDYETPKHLVVAAETAEKTLEGAKAAIREDFLESLHTARSLGIEKVREVLGLNELVKMCNTSCRQYWNENFI